MFVRRMTAMGLSVWILALCVPAAAQPSSQASASPPVALSTPAQSVGEPLLAVRMRRRISVLTEVSYNGLSGVGVNLGYQLTPNLAVDLGLGLGPPTLPKAGLRLRANFSQGRLAPMAAVAVTIIPESEIDGVEHLQLNAMAQAMLGASFVASSGFSLVAGLGYAQRLTPQHSHNATDRTELGVARLFDMLLGSGPVASIACGYSF